MLSLLVVGDAESEVQAAVGLSNLILLEGGEREDDSDLLIVVEGAGDDGPTRGEGDGRTRGELFDLVVVVFGSGGGGRARNDRGTPEQSVGGIQSSLLSLPDLTFCTKPSCSRKLFAKFEHGVEARITRLSFR